MAAWTQTVARNKVLDRTTQSSTGQRKTQTIYTDEGNGEQLETIRNQGTQSDRWHTRKGCVPKIRGVAFQNKTGNRETQDKTSLQCDTVV